MYIQLSSASIEVCKNRKLLKRPPSDEFPTMITDDVNCDGSVKCFDPSFELPDQFPLEPTGCNVSDKGTDSVELTDMLMDDLDIPYYQQVVVQLLSVVYRYMYISSAFNIAAHAMAAGMHLLTRTPHFFTGPLDSGN